LKRVLRLRRKRSAPDAQALFAQIDELARANRASRDVETERRILKLRHLAGAALVASANGSVATAEPGGELPTANGAGLPEFSAAELTPALVRAALLRDGCVLVRGLVDREEATRLAGEIDRVFDARQEHGPGGSDPDGYYDAFIPEPPYGLAERDFVTDAGGAFASDSPRLMFDVFEAFERAGLRELIMGYLGERPTVSVNKCVLRRVSPDSGSAWHQDGAFLGRVRALNVWLSLSRCGDESPGLDIVPRRLDGIVPTGTEGALFNWSVSPQAAKQAAGENGILRPIFEPGDGLLFDDLFLHATAADPEMPNHRYAVESWFFGPSAFPADYVPLAF